MKLRLKGNTLRLRLTRSEVATVASGGRVEEALVFGARPQDRLAYAIEARADLADVHAALADGCITVSLPRAAADRWADSDTVGISAEVPNEGGVVHVLIEKDFACLSRTGEDADAYPNPEGAGCQTSVEQASRETA